MRCSLRSTTSFGSAVLLLAGPALSAEGPEDHARTAIVEAVQHRVGSAARVDVESLELRVATDPGADVTATPDPRGVLGRAMRFILFEPAGLPSSGRRSRIGYAQAVVHVSLEHTTAVRRITGGSIVGPDDVVVTNGDIGAARLERLPTLSEVVGARARRALEPGAPIVGRMLTIPPLVTSGESVVTTARIGSIEARGRAIAAQRGQLGDIIRLVNPESGRRLRGRVVARGHVEVIHEP